MGKLIYKNKIKYINSRKKIKIIFCLSKKFKVRQNIIAYLMRLINKHGKVRDKKVFNNYYTTFLEDFLMVK